MSRWSYPTLKPPVLAGGPLWAVLFNAGASISTTNGGQVKVGPRITRRKPGESLKDVRARMATEGRASQSWGYVSGSGEGGLCNDLEIAVYRAADWDIITEADLVPPEEGTQPHDVWVIGTRTLLQWAQDRQEDLFESEIGLLVRLAEMHRERAGVLYFTRNLDVQPELR